MGPPKDVLKQHLEEEKEEQKEDPEEVRARRPSEPENDESMDIKPSNPPPP